MILICIMVFAGARDHSSAVVVSWDMSSIHLGNGK